MGTVSIVGLFPPFVLPPPRPQVRRENRFCRPRLWLTTPRFSSTRFCTMRKPRLPPLRSTPARDVRPACRRAATASSAVARETTRGPATTRSSVPKAPYSSTRCAERWATRPSSAAFRATTGTASTASLRLKTCWVQWRRHTAGPLGQFFQRWVFSAQGS